MSPESISELEKQAAALGNHWGGDSIRHSIELYKDAANAWREAGEINDASRCLRASAELSTLIADYPTAFNSLRLALNAKPPINDDERSLVLSALSNVARQAGNTAESERYYKEALQIGESSSSPLIRTNAYLSAGEFNFYFGSLSEATSNFELALSFAYSASDEKLISRSMLNLAYSLRRQGDPLRGLELAKESLGRSEKIGDRRGVAISYFGIGHIYSSMGQKRQALDSFRQAEAMFPEDVDLSQKANLLNGIATIYEEYGETQLAETYRQNALDLYRKTQYLFGQLATLPSLARLLYFKGQNDEGRKLVEESIELASRLKDTYVLATIHEDMGGFDYDAGRYQEAIDNYQKASAVYRRLGVKVPQIDLDLGKTYLELGDLARAEHFLNQSNDTNRLTQNEAYLAEGLYQSARLFIRQNDLDSALMRVDESIALTESLFRNITNNRLQRSFLSNVSQRYETGIWLLMQLHKSRPSAGYDSRALQLAEMIRARSMLQNLQLADDGSSALQSSDLIRREREVSISLSAKADILTSMLTAGGHDNEIQTLNSQISILENELEEIRAEIKRSNPFYSALTDPAPFDLSDFQGQVLDDDTLLLEFSLGTHESYLWILSKNEKHAYVLPPRERIEAEVFKLRELLGSREVRTGETVDEYQRRIRDSEAEYWTKSQILSNLLLGPAADKLNKNRIVVVADGKLQFFPLASLPLPHTNGSEPMLVTKEVSYSPSASISKVLYSNQSRPTSKDLLVVSDPVFSENDPRFQRDIIRKPSNDTDLKSTDNFRFAESLRLLPRLPDSKVEADSILDIIGDSASTTFDGISANRERVLGEQVSDYKIIHLATHGFVDEEHPELSGIVLSRFGENGKELSEVVRLQDIYSLKLKADLVVLSACNTAVGKDVRGEGSMSLDNAFLQAGARSVVSSFWKVEDAATQRLMQDFYRGLAEDDQRVPEALHKAQLKMFEDPQFRSPFYWAAFTAHGDFRAAPKLSVRHHYLFYSLIFGATLLAGFLVWWLWVQKSIQHQIVRKS